MEKDSMKVFMDHVLYWKEINGVSTVFTIYNIMGIDKTIIYSIINIVAEYDLSVYDSYNFGD